MVGGGETKWCLAPGSLGSAVHVIEPRLCPGAREWPRAGPGGARRSSSAHLSPVCPSAAPGDTLAPPFGSPSPTRSQFLTGAFSHWPGHGAPLRPAGTVHHGDGPRSTGPVLLLRSLSPVAPQIFRGETSLPGEGRCRALGLLVPSSPLGGGAAGTPPKRWARPPRGLCAALPGNWLCCLSAPRQAPAKS